MNEIGLNNSYVLICNNILDVLDKGYRIEDKLNLNEITKKCIEILLKLELIYVHDLFGYQLTEIGINHLKSNNKVLLSDIQLYI